jgi:hypothetical protein
VQGFARLDLQEVAEVIGEEKIKEIIAEFSCPYNADVEDFLHNKAEEFAKQGLATTHLIFASYQDKMRLVGYFALAYKYFHIDLNAKGKVGSNLRHRLRKFASYDDNLKRWLVPAPLIAQLGKNYANGYNELITGDELLKIACDTVKEAQRLTSGRVTYLECEDVKPLLDFYQSNGFSVIGWRELDSKEVGKFKSNYLLQLIKYLGR